MKTKLPLVAALSCMAFSNVNAFTLDFAGYEGLVMGGTPVTIHVPGYGQLAFEAASGSSLVINSVYLNDNGFGAPSLSFDENEAVKITFLGLDPLNVDFDFVGLSSGEDFVVQTDLFMPHANLVTLRGSGDGAGIYAVSWNTVPEPASATLGMLGVLTLALRRRR